MIASFHMDQEALIWFQEAEEAGVFSDWESLVQALHVRFGSTAYDDPMEVLTRLRQMSTVALYKAKFEAVSNRIKGLSPLHKMSCFLSGLKDEIRLPVRASTAGVANVPNARYLAHLPHQTPKIPFIRCAKSHKIYHM